MAGGADNGGAVRGAEGMDHSCCGVMRPYASTPMTPGIPVIVLDPDPDPELLEIPSPIGTESGTAGSIVGIEAETVETEDGLCNSTCFVV